MSFCGGQKLGGVKSQDEGSPPPPPPNAVRQDTPSWGRGWRPGVGGQSLRSRSSTHHGERVSCSGKALFPVRGAGKRRESSARTRTGHPQPVPPHVGDWRPPNRTCSPAASAALVPGRTRAPPRFRPFRDSSAHKSQPNPDFPETSPVCPPCERRGSPPSSTPTLSGVERALQQQENVPAPPRPHRPWPRSSPTRRGGNAPAAVSGGPGGADGHRAAATADRPRSGRNGEPSAENASKQIPFPTPPVPLALTPVDERVLTAVKVKGGGGDPPLPSVTRMLGRKSQITIQPFPDSTFAAPTERKRRGGHRPARPAKFARIGHYLQVRVPRSVGAAGRRVHRGLPISQHGSDLTTAGGAGKKTLTERVGGRGNCAGGSTGSCCRDETGSGPAAENNPAEIESKSSDPVKGTERLPPPSPAVKLIQQMRAARGGGAERGGKSPDARPSAPSPQHGGRDEPGTPPEP
ncbi:hypothetical protein FQA47_019185 [Oryzias melastigma]|uniref:Uncharacterized protein n=1 Tax=Oryzias melastigma TaxID=30732 RepID=A0A834F2H3_ORYME|nr:hypothetical protein FQA47_019185 [Oryzias melastigma]